MNGGNVKYQTEMYLPAIFSLLINIQSRQAAMSKVMVEIFASAGLVTSWSESLLAIEAETSKIRESFLNQMYAEYGELHPDIKKMFDHAFRDEK
ncbi:MAG: hypothetical protein ACJ75F_14560 [Flavisolibacter sp.]|jgi:hypothetical protein